MPPSITPPTQPMQTKVNQLTYAICVPILSCAGLLLLLLGATILESKLADNLVSVHTTVTEHAHKYLSPLSLPLSLSSPQPTPAPTDRGLSTEEHLIIAAKQGNLTTVTRALNRMQIHDSHRHAVVDMALYYAAEFDHVDIVSHLLSREGVDPNEAHHQDGHTALSIASSKGHDDVVQLLLLLRGSSININLRAKRGKTALMWASIYGRTKVVQLLTGTQRCNLELRDRNYKRTALMWATATHHTAIVEILLRAGANPLAQGTKNPHLKVQFRSQPHVSAMHIAQHYKHHEAVKHLERHIKARTHTIPESVEHAVALDMLREETLGSASREDDEL